MGQAASCSTSVTVRTGPTAFVGRELDTVVDVLIHRPAAVLVEGEPGIGRSRVLTELARRSEFAGWRVLRGTCQPLREPFPYGPVLEALRAAGERPLGPLSPVAGVLRPLLPELAGALPRAPEPLDDVGARRHRVFRAVRELLVACGPTILLVDDLQWADEGTGDLMRFLAADLPPELAVVAAYRTDAEPWPGPLGAPVRAAPTVHTAWVRLGPLEVAAVRAMAVDVLGAARVDDDFVAKLHEYTGGIPFVVEETLRGVPVSEELEVPAPVRESIRERLAALPDEAVRLTQAAAVLAVPAEVAVLADVAGLGDDQRPTALTAGLLADLGENRYGFRHPFAREAVYETVSGPERARLHTEAMRVLAAAASPPSELLAQHARAAGRRSEWLRYAEAAADEAIARGETSRAIDLLQSVLPASDDAGRLATKLGRVALHGFRPDVIETLEHVLADRSLPRAVRGPIRLSLGELLVRTVGRLGRGRAEVERAVRELVDRPELAARGINLLARPVDGLTPLSWHEGWLRRARAVHSGLSDPELRLALTAGRIANASYVGDGSAWAEFEALSEGADSDSERVQLARLWCDLADAQSWAGHLDRAARLADEGARRAEDSGARYSLGRVEGTQARLAWFRGDWDGLAETAADVRSRYPSLGPIVMETSLVLGGLAAVRGEFAAAQRHLARASVHAPGDGPIPVVLCAAAVLIGVLLAGDDIAGACSVADVAVDAARRKDVWVWAASLVPAVADAYTRAGRWSDAEALVAEFARGIDGRDSPLAAASLCAGRGVLMDARGKHSAAAAVFDAAASAFGGLPMPYPATAMAERAARSRLLAGERTAVDALSAAATAYERLGATRDAGRCHHLLRSHGAWAPSQRGRRGYGRELSPREREVARMLAEGRTNREIADGLFLSPRTVEQHVAKVLRKLGARSRTDVARHLPAEGAVVP